MLLPKVKKTASNTGSGWAATEAAMRSKPVIGATKKGPKKRTHTDPYAGGKASGKQAQPDARQPKRPRMSVASTVEDPVASSLMSDAGLDLPQEPAQVEAIYEL
ncbi:hypothetical protein B0H14DRAFT_2575577 [Mycena olivaceomarginata]|nr:hypothetical protein B0H14DRAFT_2575577 [Mycena olivaceomarginata]